MATSMAAVSRRLYHRLLLTNPRFLSPQISRSLFSTKSDADAEGSTKSDADAEGSALNSDSDYSPDLELDSSTSSASPSSSASDSAPSTNKRTFVDAVLEDGLDVGIYKAVIVGQIGQIPLEKKNKNGTSVILTSVGTGGLRNERVPFANEQPREYADRSTVQWHRVAVYHPSLGKVLMTQGQPGTLVYLEGNLETRIFSDPISGLVRRIREIAVRRNGRIVFLGGSSDYKPSDAEIRGVGYF